MLADLEIGRVRSRLDEIASRIDHEQPVAPALALAADQDRGVRASAFRLDRIAIAVLQSLHRLADQLGHAIHAGGVEDRLDVRIFRRSLDRLFEPGDDALRDREVAGGRHADRALARAFPGEHLREARDVVDAGIGARVGQQHEAVGDAHSDAIGHGRMCPRIIAAVAVAVAAGSSRYRPRRVRSARRPKRRPAPRRSRSRVPAPRRRRQGRCTGGYNGRSG